MDSKVTYSENGMDSTVSKPMIFAKNLSFAYQNEDEDGNTVSSDNALNGVNVVIRKGEFTVILGTNGSGKSTFARHINALLLPTEGTVLVEGMDTKEEANIWLIRQKAGMIFQNPDNQMIASIVEEDVAFGPENLGIESSQIRINIDEALKAVEMTEFLHASPSRMSGGQKQRIAIAGILAMKPECIILDEPTAMLDPRGRQEVINTLLKLNKEEKMTVIHITHYMEEAAKADRVIVMDKGKVIMDGSPKEVFVHVEELKAMGLDVPPMTELAYRLRKQGIMIDADILNVEEMVDALCRSN